MRSKPFPNIELYIVFTFVYLSKLFLMIYFCRGFDEGSR